MTIKISSTGVVQNGSNKNTEVYRRVGGRNGERLGKRFSIDKTKKTSYLDYIMEG